jgi:hypothetical protein
MLTFFLLFAKPLGGFTQIDVRCATTENTNRLRDIHHSFERIHDLQTFLEAAGVSEYEFKLPLNAVYNGFSSFMPVSADVAMKLGLLDPPL